jgi:hypothetical protein
MTDMAIQNDTVDEVKLRIRLYRENHSYSLDLSDLGLEKVPHEIKDLRSLMSLNLSENALTELPCFIGSFASLKHLNVSYNRIAALPQEIGSLASLETLNIRCNVISAIPDTIGNLTMLTYLDVSHNRLSALPETVNALPLLEDCNIKGNDILHLPEKIANLIKPKQLAITGHMEKIIDLSGSNGLSDSFFIAAKAHIEYVAEKLGITPIQAVLFSHIVAEYDNSPVSFNEVARSLKCNKIKLIQYMGDFDALADKKLIRIQKSIDCRYGHERGAIMYRIPSDVTAFLAKGDEYHPVNSANLSIHEFFSRLEELFDQRTEYSEISSDDLKSGINALMDDNKEQDYAKKIRGYCLRDNTLTMFLYFCNSYANLDNDEIDLQPLSSLFDHQSQFSAHKRQLKNGDHSLITGGFIENTNSEGFSDRESFKLTDKVKRELLSDFQIKANHNAKNIIRANTIKEKKLFYNGKEAEQISRLSSLLSADAFKDIQARLSESKMRTGFACLFYGHPGTGKSETVYQIARETGRDIVMVDIAETKSMWFGESEKKIKEIFTRYRNLAEELETTPILLFNEADAVIGKRKNISTSAVAQTENAIQNIILQEMENLNGILIATTNLTENLDKAFERRFIYKIEFKKPELAIRQSIWQSMIPSLSDEDAKTIASRFDFSGGQIENIARKRTVEFILAGAEPTFEKLTAFCYEELLNKEGTGKIGFAV